MAHEGGVQEAQGLRLVITDTLGRRSIAVERAPFSIGRGSDNDLQLTDARVSRQHAQLISGSGGWCIRDCGSRFGTFVNDLKVGESPLKTGDRIRLGQTELRLEPEEATSLSSASFDFRQMNALLTGLRALGSSNVLDEVLAIVLDSALDLTGAERGFILLAQPGGGLALRLARARGGTTLASPTQTSRRIPEEVFATGVDKIVTDLLDEAHAPLHAGTVALGIRHVLCTPLKIGQYGAGGERRIGVLYLDSRERGYLRTASALHVLAAEAAVVIDNARLYDEVLVKERVAQELRIAAEMQRALLPPPSARNDRAELAAATTPCRDVGGDLFDYFLRPDGGFSFVVADVAGKGTSAALLTAVVQGLFAAQVDGHNGPSDVITAVNRILCRRAIGARFVTAFYGEIGVDRRLRYCNAGHNPPFLVRPSGVVRLTDGGTVLGLFEDRNFQLGNIPVSAGDTLVLFSDGVTEAANAAGDEFTDDRLAECLEGAWRQSPSLLLKAMQDSLSAFCGAATARDDVTMMVVQVR